MDFIDTYWWKGLGTILWIVVMVTVALAVLDAKKEYKKI